VREQHLISVYNPGEGAAANRFSVLWSFHATAKFRMRQGDERHAEFPFPVAFIPAATFADIGERPEAVVFQLRATRRFQTDRAGEPMMD